VRSLQSILTHLARETWDFADAEILYRTHESPPLEPNQSHLDPPNSSLCLPNDVCVSFLCETSH